jgi:hypothetical protein
MCIWHLTAYTSPRRYRRAAAVIADPAIIGLVFPLPDPQNAVTPSGRRWSKSFMYRLPSPTVRHRQTSYLAVRSPVGRAWPTLWPAWRWLVLG